MIQVTNFSFTYINEIKPALSNINLNITDGEFILLAGQSGSGKSTLIRAFNGLIPNFYGGRYSGKVIVEDHNVKEYPTRFLSKYVGMVFQNPDNQLFMNDVESEIAFGLENLNLSRKLIKIRIEETLNAVGISNLKNRAINSLSGGEKQRVAICAVLAMEPKVLILDEPTAELDPKSAEDVLMIVQKLNKEFGLSVILVEHRIERVINFVDRIIVMKSGRILYDDIPRKILKNDLLSDGIFIPPIIQLYFQLG